jgi:hypothetical protein
MPDYYEGKPTAQINQILKYLKIIDVSVHKWKTHRSEEKKRENKNATAFWEFKFAKWPAAKFLTICRNK